jgi:hypothetical protein
VAVTVVSSTARPAGRHDVYDLTVADEHEFIAAGIVVHNCTYLAALLTNTSGIASLGRADDRVPTRSTSRARGTSRITRSTRR